MKKVSMQDIADNLGVSKGTVSLVLSGKAKNKRVSEEMCEKVRLTAKAMDYQINEIARSLRTGQTHSIGLVLTDISNEFYAKLASCIQEQAKKYGYTVIITCTNESLEEFDKMITVLLNKSIDGFILVPVDHGEYVMEKIINNRVSVVQIDRYYPDIEANYIGVNNYQAAADATESLIKIGCRKIAVVNYDIDINTLTERRNGYIDTLRRYHLYDPDIIKNIDYENDEEEIKQAIIELRNHPHKIDAVFFCTRKLCFIGIKYMHQFGIKIPQDLLVLCFDKISLFEITNIPFNYIEQPIKEIGEKAVDMLIEQINGSKEVQRCILDTKIKFADECINERKERFFSSRKPH
jgi:LacI family transcriptional regulator